MYRRAGVGYLLTREEHATLRGQLCLLLLSGLVLAIVGSSMYWFPEMIGLTRVGARGIGFVLQILSTASFAIAFAITLTYAESMKRMKIRRYFMAAGVGLAIGLFGLLAMVWSSR